MEFVPPLFGPATGNISSIDITSLFDDNGFFYGDPFGDQQGDSSQAYSSQLEANGMGMSDSDTSQTWITSLPPAPTQPTSLSIAALGAAQAAAAQAEKEAQMKAEEDRKRKYFALHASATGEHTSSYSDKIPMKDLTEQQKLERRERNREHAKRSRIRKKFMLDCLQEQLMGLRKENMNLRQVVQENMPEVATSVLEKSISERALILSGDSRVARPPRVVQKPSCLLVEPDLHLINALLSSQQNFTISDPSLPDNPIVYASQGFLNLTGYTIDKVIGRNCRFLQGPGTDPRSVDVIRKGVAEGRDTSICLLNYRADGSPFWNQFFVAALKDQNGRVVNFVGVQAAIRQSRPEEFKEKLKKVPVPEELMRAGTGTGANVEEYEEDDED